MLKAIEIKFGKLDAALNDEEEANACARRRWRELILNTAGKVTASDWRDFQIRFCEIWHDVPEANEDEAWVGPGQPEYLGPNSERRASNGPQAGVWGFSVRPKGNTHQTDSNQE